MKEIDEKEIVFTVPSEEEAEEQSEKMLKALENATPCDIVDLVELERDICYACHSRHNCEKNNCAMAEVVAQGLYKAGYRKFTLKHDESDYYLTEEDAKGEERCNKCCEQVRRETAQEIEDLVLHFSTATFDKDSKPIIKLDTGFYKALKEKYKIPLDNDDEEEYNNDVEKEP